jgi:hypothetical protein
VKKNNVGMIQRELVKMQHMLYATVCLSILAATIATAALFLILS